MFALPKLPYAEDALAPHISAQTLTLHHGKHHKSYVDTLNALLEGGPMAELSLEDVIQQSYGDAAQQKIFNNAAQSWNHDFLWKSMDTKGGGEPTGNVNALVERDIGNAQDFAKAFSDAGAGHFGSGWLWLILNEGKVEIMTTHDADLPMVHGHMALLTCDLWEHAYYLDRQNRRPEYIEAFLANLVNWDFANANLAKVT